MTQLLVQLQFVKERCSVSYCGEPELHRLTTETESDEGNVELDEVIIHLQGVLAEKLLPPFRM